MAIDDLADLERWGLEEGFTSPEEIAADRERQARGLLPLRRSDADRVDRAHLDNACWDGGRLRGMVDELRRRDEPADVPSTAAPPAPDRTKSEELRELVRTFPRKFEAEDLTDELRALAQSYVKEYEGDFDWMLAQRRRLERFGSLFESSLKGVLKVLRAELRRLHASRSPVAGETTFDVRQIPAGGYAVRGGDDQVVFYRVEQAEGRWEGWVFFGQVVGGRPSIRIGSARPGQGYRGGRVGHLEEIARDPRAAAELYGRELGVCGVCGRTLTDEESRAAGIGPVCAERRGWGSPAKEGR